MDLLVALDLDHLLEDLPEAWGLDRLVDLLVALVERLEGLPEAWGLGLLVDLLVALDLGLLVDRMVALGQDHLVASQADSMVELVLILPKWILPPMLVL